MYVNVFLSYLRHCSILTLEEGVMGSLIYSQLVRSTGDTLDMQLACEVGDSLVGLRLSPMGSGAISRECRTEPDCRTFSVCCITCASD